MVIGMVNHLKRVSEKIGLSPGSLYFVGNKKTENFKLYLMDYDENNLSEKQVEKIEDCFPFKETPSVTWLNVDGLHETEYIEKLGKHYNIHPLVLEDVLNTNQRPKIEIFDDYIFFSIKMLRFNEEDSTLDSEQVSIILGKNYVISFQEKPGDIFDPLRERIRKGKGRLRKMNPDYLTYAILDIVIDYYFMILEKIGEKIEKFEEDLLVHPKRETLNEIYGLKREVLYLRKAIWPLRESIAKLERSESSLVHPETIPYLRDLYDHAIQVIDTVETSRDLLSGMLDLYLSSISNKMNEVMKVLTIIATIFIPLTFIAGIYGMNFDNMPELHWHLGYYVILGLMFIVGIIMVLFFRRKNWL